MDEDSEMYVYHTHIEGCSACGGAHHLFALPLEMPEEESGYLFTHFSMCPETGEEILIILEPDEE